MKKFKTIIRHKLADKFKLSVLENKLVRFLKDDLKTVFDVGANKGIFTKQLRSFRNIEKVYFCEPNIKNNVVLLNNKQPNDSIINEIISDSISTESFNIYEAESTSSIFKFEENISEVADLNIVPKETQILNTTTVDEIIKVNGILSLDLLKIDVQGAELKVLNGCIESFSKIENIWVEVSMRRVYKDSPFFSEIYEYLTLNGFLFKSFSPVFVSKKGEILQADVLFVNENYNG